MTFALGALHVSSSPFSPTSCGRYPHVREPAPVEEDVDFWGLPQFDNQPWVWTVPDRGIDLRRPFPVGKTLPDGYPDVFLPYAARGRPKEL